MNWSEKMIEDFIEFGFKPAHAMLATGMMKVEIVYLIKTLCTDENQKAELLQKYGM